MRSDNTVESESGGKSNTLYEDTPPYFRKETAVCDDVGSSSKQMSSGILKHLGLGIILGVIIFIFYILPDYSTPTIDSIMNTLILAFVCFMISGAIWKIKKVNADVIIKPIIKIILAVLFFICLLPMPYGYYQLVRFLAMASFAALAYFASDKENKIEMIIYIVLTILFQPLFKFAFGRTLWNAIDVVVGIGLIASILLDKPPNTSPPPQDSK